jgi:UDPglucose 6-dehydrogenase
MRIAMIGAGYVGLVSGACFSEFGHDVVCVEKDLGKLNSLCAGKIPIYEPGLDALVRSNMEKNNLRFTSDIAKAVFDADVVFLAVGTPSRHGDGYADLRFVYNAARGVAAHLRGFTVVATKSTVPVGTGDEVERIISGVKPDADFAVVSNPEFLREGSAVNDFKRPDRIIIGTDDERARRVMSEVYRPLYLNAAPVLNVARRTAELTKYASNAFLAMKITFINEMADLCENVGADVQDVARGMGMDQRIGPKFLHAGPGYGGSCFPKDATALAKTAQDHDCPVRLVETTVAINEQRRRAMARKVIRACGDHVRGKTLGILGLTFKPDTDDMRESPSVPIIRSLLDAGAKIRAYDPEGVYHSEDGPAGVEICSDPYSVAEDAVAVVIITEWNEFRSLDLQQLKRTMRTPVLVDLRNIYDPELARTAGFAYEGVGRGGDGCRAAHFQQYAAE